MMVAFGIACLFVYAINAWAAADAKPRHADAAGVASLLCLSYGMTNALVTLYGFPEAVLAFPALDAVLAFMVWRACKRHKRRWKVGLLALLVFQLALHMLCVAAWKLGTMTQGGIYNYVVMLNVSFAAQLAVVGSAGLGHAVARISYYLSNLRRALAYGGHK